jgi:hypothetical protein
MASGRRSRKPQVVQVEPLRFAHGLRVVAPDLFAAHDDKAQREPAVHIDLIRAADLVALSIDAMAAN